MDASLSEIRDEFRRYKDLADRAMSPLSDEAFFQAPGDVVNPIALIVKHLAGNLKSRWADFLTTDGEKPTRERDREFILRPEDTRTALMARWEEGWNVLFSAIDSLQTSD